MADIFLSYSRDDAETAGRLATLLGDFGWSVFWAGGLPAGVVWDEVVERELRASKCVVALWSATSVKSQWVRTEANFGLKAGTLVPASLDGTDPPLAFQLVEAAQLQRWTGSPTHPEILVLTQGISRYVAPAERATAPAGSSVRALKDEAVPVSRVRWLRWLAGVATLGLAAVLTLAFWHYRQDDSGDGVPANGTPTAVPTGGIQDNVAPDSGKASGPGVSDVATDLEREQRQEQERKQQDEAKRVAKEEADRKRKEAARKQQQDEDRKQIEEVLARFRDAYSARDRMAVLSVYPDAPGEVFAAFKRCSRIMLTFDGPMQIEFADGAQPKAQVALTNACWSTTAEKKPPREEKRRASFNMARGQSGWLISDWFLGPAH